MFLVNKKPIPKTSGLRLDLQSHFLLFLDFVFSLKDKFHSDFKFTKIQNGINHKLKIFKLIVNFLNLILELKVGTEFCTHVSCE